MLADQALGLIEKMIVFKGFSPNQRAKKLLMLKPQVGLQYQQLLFKKMMIFRRIKTCTRH
jgi:hypothetical protein